MMMNFLKNIKNHPEKRVKATLIQLHSMISNFDYDYILHSNDADGDDLDD